MSNETDDPHAGASSISSSTQGRSIGVGRDASGNAFVTGDNNNVKVVIYQSKAERQDAEEVNEPQIGRNPYMGLLAFHEQDADRFFGREKQTERLWEKLRELQRNSTEGDGPSRFLSILGPSGSGKSSLARAGLIPELARRTLPGWRDSSVVVLTPGAHPLEALARVLARIATGDSVPTAKEREFSEELNLQNKDGQYDGLRRIVDGIAALSEVPLVILVDQFEEVYTLRETKPRGARIGKTEPVGKESGDDLTPQEIFVECLLNVAADRGGRASVVITLRSDFLGETQSHDELNHLVCEQGIMIPAMTEKELQQAIAKPAELAGHPLDDATIALLTADARGREGALPLLQFALQRIWDGLAGGISPATTYQKIGGLGGALAGEAQRIYDGLDDDEQRIARRVFLGLVQLGEGTRDTRRRASLGKLVSVREDSDDVERIVRLFSHRDARLITLSAETEGSSETAEVTHEALFEHWQLLNDWLDESRDDIRFSRRLEEAARNWDEQGRPEGSLWSQSPNIDHLREFHERTGGEISALEADFFIASHGANIARLDKERRQKNRLRGLVGAATVAALVAFIMFFWALWAEEKAVDERTIAQKKELNALVDSILLAPPGLARDRIDSLEQSARTDELGEYAVAQLHAVVEKLILKNVDWNDYDDGNWNEYERISSGKANVVAALLKLGEGKQVLEQLKHSDKPDVRSYLIDRFRETRFPPEAVHSLLAEASDSSARRAVIISLGTFPAADYSDDLLKTCVEELLSLFEADPDAGVHSAAEWTLNTWANQDDARLVDLAKKVATKKTELSGKNPKGDSSWYITSGGQTMVIITPPEGGRVTIGSAKNERGRDGSGDEDRTTASIPHTYAVATTEVTNRQFRAFLNDPEKGAYYRAALGIGEATAEVFATDEDLDYPATRVSWFMAVAYCNWLTEKEWKEEASDRFCYGPATYDGQDRFTIGMTVAAADEQMLGYRLLREAEWEFACRSGTQTRYCFGEAEQLVSNYAVRGDSVATVATLRPNDFGLFDMHGNVWEWCDSWYDSSEVSRVLRGGSFSGNARNVRSACRGGIQPGDRLQYVGFRVARTYR